MCRRRHHRRGYRLMLLLTPNRFGSSSTHTGGRDVRERESIFSAEKNTICVYNIHTRFIYNKCYVWSVRRFTTFIENFRSSNFSSTNSSEPNNNNSTNNSNKKSDTEQERETHTHTHTIRNAKLNRSLVRTYISMICFLFYSLVDTALRISHRSFVLVCAILLFRCARFMC